MAGGVLEVPTEDMKKKMVRAFLADEESFTIFDEASGVFRPVICCVCDSIPTKPQWSTTIHVKKLKSLLRKCKMEQSELAGYYPPSLLRQYTAAHEQLHPFVLSPVTHINTEDQVLICKDCLAELNKLSGFRAHQRHPPKESIANGYVIGNAPVELTDLNDVELTLISRVRTYYQSWVFFGGKHSIIKGFNTFFKNRPGDNVSNLTMLSSSGMKGIILVALCGPFTTTQKALTYGKVAVDPLKVVMAWQWLKDNNFRYKDDEIPHIDSVPLPQIIEEGIQIVDSQDVDIENNINMTVVFPDTSVPQPTNGGFENQEEFRQFVAENQDGRWNSSLHARPLAEQLADYEDDTVADAFPLLFPYGFTGLAADPCVLQLATKNKQLLARTRKSVLLKYLQHQKPAFHSAVWNLVVENMLIKETIFQKTKMFCSVKNKDATTMGEKYGSMTSQALDRAIHDVRNQLSVQHSGSKEHRFLKSIRAACASLPHSNEASLEARKKYFSYLMAFGLPAIFLTVSPDDERNFRILVYALKGPERASGTIDVNDLTDEQILFDFKVRQKARFEHPGLCAEEYERIMHLVIKHFFNWNVEEQKSNGVGLFTKIDAWCLATEEQGRKTLHGHFLLFVKDWGTVLDRLQRKNQVDVDGEMSYEEAVKKAKKFYKNACSAQLFTDFAPGKKLSEKPVFHHKECRGKRKDNQMRFTVKPVSDQYLREMRHKKHCQTRNGIIGTCEKCQKQFSVNEIVANALSTHIGKNVKTIRFPEPKTSGSGSRLDRFVYELGKDLSWDKEDGCSRALRYFSANALTNVHLTTHTKRCFKKGPECYADLPDCVSDTVEILFNTGIDAWSNWLGQKEDRSMFRFQPRRPIDSVFMNTHNKILTLSTLANTNVMVGMNGRSVLYVTGYQVKSQQQEEMRAFEAVSRVFVALLERQNSAIEILPEYQLGFRRILAGIYTHTSAHIVAAPLSHFMAKNNSRFMYSHDTAFMPVHGAEKMLANEPMIMRFRNRDGTQVAYHNAMDYLHRPKDFEDLPMYVYYRDMEFTTEKNAERRGYVSEEIFMYPESHPFHKTDAVVYRKRPCVPVFGWTWMGKTKQFLSSLLTEARETDLDYKAKEEYAKKFMIAFMPFRTGTDLKENGSYSAAFRTAHSVGAFSDEMIEIANNIQDIQNSIEAGMPENPLTTDTELLVAEECPPEVAPDTDESELQSAVGHLLAGSSGETVLTEDASVFNPGLSGIQLQGNEFVHSPAVTDGEAPERLPSVLEYPEEAADMSIAPVQHLAHRFRTNTSELNTLFMQQTIIEHRDAGSDSDAPATTTTITANGTWESVVCWGKNSGLDREQQIAFETLAATYVLTFYEEADRSADNNEDAYQERMKPLRRLARRNLSKEKPLRLFVTGPAGAGKSKLLTEVQAYAKMFSQNIGHVYTKNSIRVTALTGAAAMEVGGTTAASEFSYMRARTSVTIQEIRDHADTRLNIIDEISFAGYNMVLGRISSFLQMVSECADFQFGRAAMCFLGDFCQLEVIDRKDLIYDHPGGIYWEQALNCVVELEGIHRYRDCPLYGRIMGEIRRNGLSEENRRKLNERVINGVSVKMPCPRTVQFATFHNKNRCGINIDIFRAYLAEHHAGCTKETIPDSAIVIKSNASWSNNKKCLTYEQRKVLFEQCSDADIQETGKGSRRLDPFLKLFSGSNQMVNINKDVGNGIANGAVAKFKKAKLKPGANVVPIQMFGYWVNSVSVDEVEQLEMEWIDSDRYQGRFRLSSENGSFGVNFPVTDYGLKMKVRTRMKIDQFPILGNFATTGHKLQGKSVDAIVIAEWNKTRNWAYVVLSRVRTFEGLFLTKPIPADINFAPVPANVAMMERLRQSKKPTSIDTNVIGWFD